MTHGSLFSGIGGFDLASEWAGWENLFHCEINPFGQKVLKYYWPHAESFSDITKTDFTKYANKIDVLTGGFPCQPYSQAGKRLGKEDDRHLWPEMLRAIREIQPRWVVGENVFGIVNWNGGLVFNEVQTDLEAEGYEVQPFLLPACAVDAPHRRDRVWFVAYSGSDGHKQRGSKKDRSSQGKGEEKRNKRQWVRNDRGGNGEQGNAAHSNCEGLSLPRHESEKYQADERFRAQHEDSKADATNASRKGFQRSSKHRVNKKERAKPPYKQSFGFFQPNWQNFPTQSPLRSRNDGVPSRLDGITVSKHRRESIKAMGNAIVPQVVYQIFKAINVYETH